VNGPRALIPAARYAPGMDRTGMISTDSPGKIAKCGWFSNSFAAVCTENSDSNVLVMQAADQGMRYDASGALNRARDGRILV
jgi:hypothetical protein